MDICRRYGISQGTFYNWKAKYDGMNLSMLKQVKELEQENHRLKKMYADSKMDNEILLAVFYYYRFKMFLVIIRITAIVNS